MQNLVDDDNKALLCLVGLKGNTDGSGSGEMVGLEKGIDFDWNKPPLVSGLEFVIEMTLLCLWISCYAGRIIL